MHTRLPSVLTCKRLVGSVKQRTTSPRKNLLFFCLTSLFANLFARIPSVCHAAQICKPPSQSKKYLHPPLPEKIFSLLSRKFVRHISTLHCLLQGLRNSPTPKQNTIQRPRCNEPSHHRSNVTEWPTWPNGQRCASKNRASNALVASHPTTCLPRRIQKGQGTLSPSMVLESSLPLPKFRLGADKCKLFNRDGRSPNRGELRSHLSEATEGWGKV